MAKRVLCSRWLALAVTCLVAGCGAGADLKAAEAPTGPAPAETASAGSSAMTDSSNESGAEELELTQVSSVQLASLSSTRAKEGPRSPSAPVRAPAPSTRAPAPAPGAPADATSVAVATSEQRAPLLIYAATVTMAVFGLDAALGAVETLAHERHGYLVKRGDATITIRVPAAAFDETLSGVSKLGDELHREVSARDVTEQYADLEIRLRNAEVVRQRLETLLAKASSVEEALTVERELARVTETIEQLKGKLKLLGELVAFSTITVNFQAPRHEHVTAQPALPFDWLGELGLSNLLAL
jgi:hypothetical protein